jgi:predicted molibdopterin-dependent oxidoreductase YjgC
MFEPYERLIEIRLAGRTVSVPENNTILRCLQFLDIERISDADLCWNGDCLNCTVWIASGTGEKAVIACRTLAAPGMSIIRTSEEVEIGNPGHGEAG